MSEKNANHTHPPYRKYETTAAYNLPDSKPESRQGQMVCVDGGHLKRCEENLNVPKCRRTGQTQGIKPEV